MGSGASKEPQVELQEHDSGRGIANSIPASRKSASRMSGGSSRQSAKSKRSGSVSQLEENHGRMAVLLKHTDETTLSVIRLVMQAESIPSSKAKERLKCLEQCQPILDRNVSAAPYLYILVFTKQGECYLLQKNFDQAKDYYNKAISIAEKLVAQRGKDLYLTLSHYVQAMIGLSFVWYEQEKEKNGFQFTDSTRSSIRGSISKPVSSTKTTSDPLTDDTTAIARAASVMSMVSSVSSGGSVFSLNHAMLKAMIPHAHRQATGPSLKRITIRAPHCTPGTEYVHKVEEEFVLYNNMTKELRASPCELLLLRCCEVVELGHCRQSELLTPALEALAQLYEDLELHSRAILLIRRCVGIILSAYDYDHPTVVRLRRRIEELSLKLEMQLKTEKAIKIQSTWKMYLCMRQLEEVLGRPVHRHIWIAKKFRPSDNEGFLSSFLGIEEPDTEAVVAEEEPHTLTAFFPNAKVIGATQEITTETMLEESPAGGDVLTVQTTTVRKTVAVATGGYDEEGEERETDSELLSQSGSRRHHLSIHGSDQSEKNVFVSIPAGAAPGLVQESPCAPHATQTVNIAMDAQVAPAPEGDVLTIRQVAITQTITAEADTEAYEHKTENLEEELEQEDLYSGLVDDSQSESTFFTHRSQLSHSFPARDVPMIVRGEAVKESLPTRLHAPPFPSTSKDRISSSPNIEEASRGGFVSVNPNDPGQKLRLPSIHSGVVHPTPPRVPVARNSSNASNASGRSSGSQKGASEQRLSSAGKPTRSGSGANGSVEIPRNPSLSPANRSSGVLSLHLRPDGSSASPSHKSRSGSQMSSIVSSARRNRAWEANEQ